MTDTDYITKLKRTRQQLSLNLRGRLGDWLDGTPQADRQQVTEAYASIVTLDVLISVEEAKLVAESAKRKPYLRLVSPRND